ncbi:MAG: inorganic phosphate transporter [Sphingobacteriales bacterium]|nr:MAG: inorganic phosphate transporter [Sphingobacteriales bacterium]
MTALLIVIIALALIFDYINGFHDAANSIATVVSTKVLTPFQAVLWAALFNFVAFFIFKDHGVADSISKIAKHATLEVVFSGILAAICWNLLTWWYGIPSSSSHTLIGGFAGAAVAGGGLDAINQEPIIKTVSFIVLAPVIGMIIAFIISLWFISSFKKGIKPKLVSLAVIIGVFVMLHYNIVTHPEHLKTHYESYVLRVIMHGSNFKWLLLATIFLSIAVFTMFLSSLNVASAQVWFKRMQLVSSAAFSIGHGGNDAQKVMGIITVAIIIHSGLNPKDVTDINSIMPTWVPLACYTAISAGTMSGGWKIIKTMGTRITKVTPFEGVAAESAGAITLFVTEALKIPVSTTHTITGSIIGVGATKRLSAVRWGVTINLLWAWILTIPVSALLAASIYFIVKLFI